MTPTIEQFFQDFERTSNNFNAVESGAQFSDVFMHADQHGVSAIPKDAFIASLSKRKAFFNSIGLQTTTLTVTEETRLNDSYVLARVRINMLFATKGKDQDVEQTATYIVKIDGDAPQIVFYLNDQLLTDVLAAHHLAANNS